METKFEFFDINERDKDFIIPLKSFFDVNPFWEYSFTFSLFICLYILSFNQNLT